MSEAYPLSWPAGRPRTPPAKRKAGRFSKQREGVSYRTAAPLSVADAIRRLDRELDTLGGRSLVLSSNIELRLNGLPRSGQREPDDPGVAVYFQLAGKPHCMPCDTYQRVADNIAAVAAHIEATRAIERHGVGTVAEMFAGFQALPPPFERPWWVVLDVPSSARKTEIEAAFRQLARERHPDRGGSDRLMAELNRARAAALEEAA